MNKSLKTVIPAACSAAIIALCLWLPSLFITEGQTEEKNITPTQTTEESIQISDEIQPLATRVDMWRSFWNGDENYYSKRSSIDELGDDAYDRYDGLMENIEPLDMFFLDTENNSTSSANYEYIVYYDSTGTALRMYHLYREWTGDWSNWTELYFDADDATIYYFYISSGCRSNFDVYKDSLENYKADGAALLWGDLTGMTLSTIDWTEDPADAAYVVYLKDGTDISCRINWIYYESNLFDFKVLVV